MHGRHDFRLTDAERKQLREYLERGGTVLADCDLREPAVRRRVPPRARRRPARSAARAHPGRRSDLHDRLRRLRHPPGLAPRSRKRPATSQPVAARIRQVEPQLEGIKIDGRWAVIFSPFDISCAWKATKPSAAAATPNKTPPASASTCCCIR